MTIRILYTTDLSSVPLRDLYQSDLVIRNNLDGTFTTIKDKFETTDNIQLGPFIQNYILKYKEFENDNFTNEKL